MPRITSTKVKNKIELNPDDGVREIGRNGRIPAAILYELLASHIPDAVSDFDFRYVGRGRSDSEILMLIVAQKERITKSVIKCGPAVELNAEKRKWRIVKHLDRNIYPTRTPGRKQINGFTSVEYSLASGSEEALTFADALLSSEFSQFELDGIIKKVFDALYRGNQPHSRSRHPFSFPWRGDALNKIRQELIDQKFDHGESVEKLIAFTNRVPSNWIRTSLTSHRAFCHGDLNAGNLLIGVGRDRSISPCLIDFTWLTSRFAPSLDYAKLERDIRLRCLKIAENKLSKYSEILCSLDESFDSESANKNVRSTHATAKCIHAINTIRQEFKNKFPVDKELANVEYIFHLLCWILTFSVTPEYEKLERPYRIEIIKSALRLYGILERKLIAFRAPATSSSDAEEFHWSNVAQSGQFNECSRRKNWFQHLQSDLKGITKWAVIGVALLGVFIVLERPFHKNTSTAPPSPVLPAQQNASMSHTAIYLANIVGPEDDKFHITARLREALNTLPERFHEMEILNLDQPVNGQNIKAVVQELKDKHAFLLIWGHYEISDTHILIDLHFETPSSFNPFISGQEAQIYPKSKLHNFELTTKELPQYVTTMGMIAEGIALYMRGDFKPAEDVLYAVLDRPQISPSLLNEITFILILSQNQAGRLREAQRSIEKALAHSNAFSSSDLRGLYAYYVGNILLIDPAGGLAVCHKNLDAYIRDPSADPQEASGITSVCSMAGYLSGNNTHGDKYRKQRINFLARIPKLEAIDHIQAGTAYEQLCDYDLALNEYYQADKLSPADSAILSRIAFILARQGDFAHANAYSVLARESQTRYIPLPSPGGVALTLNGVSGSVRQEYTNTDRNQTTIESLMRAIEVHPRAAVLYQSLGQQYEIVGDEVAAFKNYEAAIGLDPDNSYLASSYWHRGKLFAKINRLKDAKDSFDKAIELNSLFSEPLLERGLFFAKTGEFKRAQADLTKALELETRFKNSHFCMIRHFDPQYYARLLLERGAVRVSVGDTSGALQDFIQAGAAAPGADWLHIRLASEYARVMEKAKNKSKRFWVQLVEIEYGEAIKLRPNDVDYQKAKCDWFAGYDSAAAFNCYTDLISHFPNNRDLYLNRVHVQQSYQGIISDYTAALKIKEDADTLFNRSTMYIAIKDWRNALLDLNRSLELREWDIPYWQRSFVKRQLGDWKGAAEDIRIEMRLNTDAGIHGERAHLLLAQCALHLGNLTEAIDNADIVIRRDSSSSVAYEFKGDILVKQHRFSDAADCYKKSIARIKKNNSVDINSFEAVPMPQKKKTLIEKLKAVLVSADNENRQANRQIPRNPVM